MSQVFYTSDPHLGHDKVAGYRGFSDGQEWTDYFIGMWEGMVTKRDIVYVLGDLAMKMDNPMFDIFMRLPGRKHLILGNHDAGHPMHRNAWKHTYDYALAFESAQIAGQRKIAGRHVMMSHFPYERDRGEARYAEWRLPNLGKWLLHGHTHGTERVTFHPNPAPDRYMREILLWTREIHVGLDAWDLKLVPESTVIDLMSEAEATLAA